MAENMQPEETESAKTNPATPGVRNIDEAEFFGYAPEPAEKPAEIVPAQANPKYLWMGFGVVVALVVLAVAVDETTQAQQPVIQIQRRRALSQTAPARKVLLVWTPVVYSCAFRYFLQQD